jgi:hypothetical protein
MLPFLIVGAAALYALSKKSDEEFYSGSDYISDCAEEWGMSEDDVANQLGLDKD